MLTAQMIGPIERAIKEIRELPKNPPLNSQWEKLRDAVLSLGKQLGVPIAAGLDQTGNQLIAAINTHLNNINKELQQFDPLIIHVRTMEKDWIAHDDQWVTKQINLAITAINETIKEKLNKLDLFKSDQEYVLRDIQNKLTEIDSTIKKPSLGNTLNTDQQKPLDAVRQALIVLEDDINKYTQEWIKDKDNSSAFDQLCGFLEKVKSLQNALPQSPSFKEINEAINSIRSDLQIKKAALDVLNKDLAEIENIATAAEITLNQLKKKQKDDATLDALNQLLDELKRNPDDELPSLDSLSHYLVGKIFKEKIFDNIKKVNEGISLSKSSSIIDKISVTLSKAASSKLDQGLDHLKKAFDLLLKGNNSFENYINHQSDYDQIITFLDEYSKNKQKETLYTEQIKSSLLKKLLENFNNETLPLSAPSLQAQTQGNKETPMARRDTLVCIYLNALLTIEKNNEKETEENSLKTQLSQKFKSDQYKTAYAELDQLLLTIMSAVGDYAAFGKGSSATWSKVDPQKKGIMGKLFYYLAVQWCKFHTSSKDSPEEILSRIIQYVGQALFEILENSIQNKQDPGSSSEILMGNLDQLSSFASTHEYHLLTRSLIQSITEQPQLTNIQGKTEIPDPGTTNIREIAELEKPSLSLAEEIQEADAKKEDKKALLDIMKPAIEKGKDENKNFIVKALPSVGIGIAKETLSRIQKIAPLPEKQPIQNQEQRKTLQK